MAGGQDALGAFPALPLGTLALVMDSSRIYRVSPVPV